ncbi:MAG: DUF3067 family protein [Microcystaceae cyanobacterium]
MTGLELQTLIRNKWGQSYDLQLRRIKGRIFIQVMWKYLEQASFPLSEQEYLNHLSVISQYIQEWHCEMQVKTFIETTKERPRLGKAINIPLDLGDRASEWILE